MVGACWRRAVVNVLVTMVTFPTSIALARVRIKPILANAVVAIHRARSPRIICRLAIAVVRVESARPTIPVVPAGVTPARVAVGLINTVSIVAIDANTIISVLRASVSLPTSITIAMVAVHLVYAITVPTVPIGWRTKNPSRIDQAVVWVRVAGRSNPPIIILIASHRIASHRMIYL